MFLQHPLLPGLTSPGIRLRKRVRHAAVDVADYTRNSPESHRAIVLMSYAPRVGNKGNKHADRKALSCQATCGDSFPVSWMALKSAE